MNNQEISDILNRISEMLEIKGENIFKVKAYQKASIIISSLTKDINSLVVSGEIDNIDGIGKGIAGKITELLNKGKSSLYEELKKEIPQELLSMLLIPGIGPKSVHRIWKELGITTKDQLRDAVKNGILSNLKGFGKKSEENILKGLDQVERYNATIPLGRALPIAEEIIKDLNCLSTIGKLSIAGSIRRMKETVGDIDIIATSHEPVKVIDAFSTLPYFNEILMKGETKCSVLTKNGIHVDLRVVSESEFGSALYYFTGSKEHNIEVRKLALNKNLKINEYGVFRNSDNERIAGNTEEEIFKSIDLSYIPPEIRENRGEIELAKNNSLPKLVELSEIKGDLHIHTNKSDGLNSIEEIHKYTHKLGYEYIAITDHSSVMGITGGMKHEDFYKQFKIIDFINDKGIKPFILKGVEVDIKSDKSLNLTDEVLSSFDVVIASIHSGFKDSEDKMTGRILSAVYNRYVTIIGHPTGRKIAERESYNINFEKILEASKEIGTILELNSFWDRLDLGDINCRKAKEKGVMVTISTDSHSIEHFSMMKYGLATARRGWLENNNVLNTFNLKELLARIGKKRRNK